MAAEITQSELDSLKSEVLLLAPTAKRPELETDIKARVNLSLDGQARFLTRVRDAFEAAEVDRYRSEPVTVNGSNGGVRKAAATNPWSAIGWNVTEQGRICRTLGDDKGASLAKSAGVKIGDTKPNPLFN